jgi:predicted RNase H-like HicB family nuclease
VKSTDNVSIRSTEVSMMLTVKYIHWQEDDVWIGYLQDYPDYWTQGETLDDLIEHLKDLYQDLAGGMIPGARKVGELVLP